MTHRPRAGASRRPAARAAEWARVRLRSCRGVHHRAALERSRRQCPTADPRRVAAQRGGSASRRAGSWLEYAAPGRTGRSTDAGHARRAPAREARRPARAKPSDLSDARRKQAVADAGARTGTAGVRHRRGWRPGDPRRRRRAGGRGNGVIDTRACVGRLGPVTPAARARRCAPRSAQRRPLQLRGRRRGCRGWDAAAVVIDSIGVDDGHRRAPSASCADAVCRLPRIHPAPRAPTSCTGRRTADRLEPLERPCAQSTSGRCRKGARIGPSALWPDPPAADSRARGPGARPYASDAMMAPRAFLRRMRPTGMAHPAELARPSLGD